MDEAIRQAILQRRSAGELRTIITAHRADLAADARRLIEQGRTTVDEVRRVLGSLFAHADLCRRITLEHGEPRRA